MKKKTTKKRTSKKKAAPKAGTLLGWLEALRLIEVLRQHILANAEAQDRLERLCGKRLA